MPETTSSMIAMKVGPSTQPKIGMNFACCSITAWRCSAVILSARPDSSIWVFMNSVGSTLCSQMPVKPSTRAAYTTSGTRKRGLATIRANAEPGAK